MIDTRVVATKVDCWYQTAALIALKVSEQDGVNSSNIILTL